MAGHFLAGGYREPFGIHFFFETAQVLEFPERQILEFPERQILEFPEREVLELRSRF